MRKSFYVLFLLLIVGVPLFLGGCMMWMHGSDHGGEHDMRPGRTVVKEWSDADVVLTMDVPRLAAGKEAALVLKAERIRDGAPITGARVVFVIEQVGGHTTDREEKQGKGGIERETSELQKGTYSAMHRFETHGLYRITARFQTTEHPDAAAPMTLTVSEEAGGHESKKAADTWMILGGIGMVAMMILVML